MHRPRLRAWPLLFTLISCDGFIGEGGSSTPTSVAPSPSEALVHPDGGAFGDGGEPGDTAALPRPDAGVSVVSVDAGPPPVAPPAGPQHFGCPVFPPDDPWNQEVADAPVDPDSDSYLGYMNAWNDHLHPYFGSDPRWGIPITGVPGGQVRLPVRFGYASESDPGPYPIPPGVAIEGGTAGSGDRHVVIVDRDRCMLYELFSAYPDGAGWAASAGAVFNLRNHPSRPEGWTSADGAGLPILAGLVRYDEVQAGEIRHAIRFTTGQTRRGWVAPATHFASSLYDTGLPPMGLRVRLRQDFNLSGFQGPSLVILKALQRYGMILADNGANWSITGESDSRWRDQDLAPLKTVPGSAFEVVRHGPVMP